MKSCVFLVLILLSFNATRAFAEVRQSPDELALSIGWIRLMHYERAIFAKFGGWKSRMSDPLFFISPDGRKNPSAELNADLKNFTDEQSRRPSNLDDQTACRFPARYLFLKTHLIGAETWPVIECPRVDRLLSGLDAHSVTLVFSSYYLNNPASAFGHTFLRLNHASPTETHQPLLDYGVGFAASAGGANLVMFALGGLFGWFKGEFTNVPYYFKVQEYNNYEARDLWEYNLDLSDREVDLLLRHLWELSKIHIPYRYLSMNCSSLLFNILEVGAPRLQISSTLPYWVIPSDTVRSLYTVPGLVTSYDFRPSKRTQYVHRFKNLSPADQKETKRLAHTHDLTNMHAENPSAVLDALIDESDFRNFKSVVLGTDANAQWKQTVLAARSHLPPSSSDIQPIAPNLNELPQEGHPSARFGLGYLLSRDRGNFTLIDQRFALHDLLDVQRGYPSPSEIGFLDFGLRVLTQPNPARDAEGSVRLEHAYLFEVKSFVPYESHLPNISWKMRIGAERAWDETCRSAFEDCVAAVVGGGAGFTVKPIGRLLTTLLIDGDASLASDFAGGAVKLRLGPELNLRYIFAENLIAQVSAAYLHIFFEPTLDAVRISEEIRWTPKSANGHDFAPFAFGLAMDHLPAGDVESKVEAYYYF